MKTGRNLLIALSFSLISFGVSAQINLNVKIDQIVGTKTIETVKTISTNYDQDIVIAQEGLKDKVVISLKKFKNILVNGTRINPVQIDMKVVNPALKTVGKTQTVTSFYNNSAHFSVAGSNNMNVSLNFQEI